MYNPFVMKMLFKICDYTISIQIFDAGIAQLVERVLAKHKVASSRLVSRSIKYGLRV